MIIINLAHPLSAVQLAQIERLAGEAVERVLDVPVQFENGDPFAEQAAEVMERIPLAGAEWQTTPLVVNLPGHSTIAALVLAHLHGRMGYFSTIVRLRPVAGLTPSRFEWQSLSICRPCARAPASIETTSRRGAGQCHGLSVC